MTWRSAAAVLEDAEAEETERAAAVLARAEEQRDEGEGTMADDLCSVPECAAAGKLAGHRGSHRGQKPGSKASNDRGGSGVPREVARGLVPIDVRTTLRFSTAALLDDGGCIVEIADYRAKVIAFNRETGEITAEVLD